MRKEISIEKRSEIVTLRKEGNSWKEISEKSGININTVRSVYSNFLKRGSLEKKSGRGRKKKFSKRSKSLILRQVRINNEESWRGLEKIMKNQYNLDVSHETIRKISESKGLLSYVARKKPKLTDDHIRKRMDFVKRYENWNEEEWRKVLWSDEVWFYLKKNNYRKWIIMSE